MLFKTHINRLFQTLIKPTYSITRFFLYWNNSKLFIYKYSMALKLLFREMKLSWEYLWHSSIILLLIFAIYLELNSLNADCLSNSYTKICHIHLHGNIYLLSLKQKNDMSWFTLCCRNFMFIIFRIVLIPRILVVERVWLKQIFLNNCCTSALVFWYFSPDRAGVTLRQLHSYEPSFKY